MLPETQSDYYMELQRQAWEVDMPKKGRVTISRVLSNKADDYIYIQLYDDNYNLLAEIEMIPAIFALAITGVGVQRCDYQVRG